MKRMANGHQKDSALQRGLDGAPVHPVLKSYFGYCMHKLSSQMRMAFAKKLSPHKILPHQYGILIVLRESGELSQNDLGAQIGIDKASMVKIINDLTRLNYVSRKTSGRDRRVNLIEVTPQGLRALQKFSKIRQKVEDEYLAPLSQRERKSLRQLVGKLIVS